MSPRDDELSPDDPFSILDDDGGEEPAAESPAPPAVERAVEPPPAPPPPPEPEPAQHAAPAPRLWIALLLAAAAGGMGWGIRGQYGHETGAMLPGLLVALVLALLFARHAASLTVARAVALTAVAFSFGGSMTYGQTVGLTHDPELVGNWSALGWGMLGLAIKGGIWIGLGGAFLGIGLGGKRYSPLDLFTIAVLMLALLLVGNALLNEPFDPAHRVLPRIYFSDHWHWEPDKADMVPRRERWGGLLLALAGAILYTWRVKGDRLARNMALFGVLGGAVGFPAGQSLQAFHAWNPELFREGAGGAIAPYINWWNMMETTFGAIMGLGLALGLWLNRRLVAVAADPGTGTEGAGAARDVPLSMANEWILVAVHVAAIAAWDFLSIRPLDAIADLAVTMGLIPLVAIAGGRLWPYLLSLPIITVPMAGKTLRYLWQTQESRPHGPLAGGWGAVVVFLVVPLAVTAAAALLLARRGADNRGDDAAGGRVFLRSTLLVMTWLAFSLNFAVFDFPWPWREPTARTPNNAIFFLCALLLTVAALAYGRRERSAACRRSAW